MIDPSASSHLSFSLSLSLTISQISEPPLLSPPDGLPDMEEQLVTNTRNEEDEASVRSKSDLQHNNDDDNMANDDPGVYFEDVDSSCSTPFVSAPTSPDRAEQVNSGGGFFYSAPASPMHFVLCSVSPKWTPPLSEPSVSFDFGFSARLGTSVDAASGGSMTSADELFFNGQIRPMKFSSHHQQRQSLSPLPDLDESEGDYEHGTDDASEIVGRGRDVKCHDRSLRRRARSTSPLRKSSFQWLDVEEDAEKSEITEAIEDKSNEAVLGETTPSMSTSSSRSSSANRNSSKKWLFLKDLLHRSKSEGSSNNGQRFWSSISFSPVKDRRSSTPAAVTTNQEKKNETTSESPAEKKKSKDQSKKSARKVVMNGVAGKGRSRVAMSAHELHYKASRAQTEEMRKKTFLPYKQGVLGCLGFSSKSYGAMNGFARALNPVSSR